MTTRQKVLKFLSPVIVGISRLSSKRSGTWSNTAKKDPPVPFYSLSFTDNRGKEVSFKQYRGKKLLLVNTASFCGYTSQYDGLEKLHRDNRDKLVILGFPANDFGEQEPGADADIEKFCRLDYGVTFPLFKKSSVVQPNQNAVYAWLSNPALNGWNGQSPTWNFFKYVIDEKGRLIHCFGPAIEPGSDALKQAIS
ncbi:MAG TPA: glutathione peroxidase [Chitinophagaceae bacterium]|jgi:glutathione peroxidase